MGLSAAQDQEDANIMPDSVGQDKGRVDASTEDVEAAGGSWDVIQREIGSSCCLMSYYDESAHEIRKEQGVQASFGLKFSKLNFA